MKQELRKKYLEQQQITALRYYKHDSRKIQKKS